MKLSKVLKTRMDLKKAQFNIIEISHVKHNDVLEPHGKTKSIHLHINTILLFH